MDLVRPAYCHIPGYVKTDGGEVADQCAEIGYAPDAQQRLGLDAIFARRANGLSAAFEFCVIAGRQNLKSGLFKQAMTGWLFLFDERLIVYSAHKFASAMEMFRDMEQLVAGAPSLSRRVKRIVRNHGEEGIELKSGARVTFMTRTPDSGRGLSGSKVILDEAYAVKDGHVGALLPTMSAQPDPQVLYGSSAGKADSAVLRGIRDRGRAAASPRLAYLEWCAPDPKEACDAGDKCTHAKTAVGCGCDKPKYQMQANPAIGGRMTLEYVEAERQALPVGEYIRERMGWWDDPEDGVTPIPMPLWVGCADRASAPAQGSSLALAIDVAPDSSMSAIGLAGFREDGLVHGELVEYLPGTGWLIERVMGIAERRNPCVVVLDPAGPAGKFEKTLRNNNFVVLPAPKPDKPLKVPPGKRLMQLVSSRDYAQACGAFTDSVLNDLLRHPDQAPLNKAAEAARSRPVAQAWAWAGPGICPLVVVTLACLGLSVYGVRENPMPFFLT